MSVKRCELPPKGWMCTREAGHDGPCAAVKKPGFWQSLGEAIGEVMFGGIGGGR